MSSGNKGNKFARWGAVPLACAATVLMLCLALPPAGLSALAWIAFIPLLLALSVPLGRVNLLLVWIGGLVYGMIGFAYIRHVSWLGMFLLGFYISLYFVAFAALVRWLSGRKGLPLALAAPLIWTALEALRGWFLTGIPYLFLAYTQYRHPMLIQIADFAGTAGVTFLMLAVSGAAADLIRGIARMPQAPRMRTAVVGAVIVALLFGGTLFYGRYRLDSIVTRPGPSVGVVQANIPQDMKNLGAAESVLEIYGKHLRLMRDFRADPPDLIVWPETMAPAGTLDHFPPPEFFDPRYSMWELFRYQAKSDLLVSAVGFEDETHIYNSAFLLPKGTAGAALRYDKMHLVPFGEYVPLRPLIGWIVKSVVPYQQDVSPGKHPMLFECRGRRFAPTVCYEDAFAPLVADFGRGGQKTDFIVNVTNEGWFKDGIELDQHLAIGVFRAIENRAGFVRSANTGISAFISPTGQVQKKLVVGGKDREVEGVLRDTVLVTDARSPYMAVGETFAVSVEVVAAALCAGLAVAGLRARRRRKAGRAS